MEKYYTIPEFSFVRADKSNNLFFVASGVTPGPVAASLKDIVKTTGTW